SANSYPPEKEQDGPSETQSHANPPAPQRGPSSTRETAKHAGTAGQEEADHYSLTTSSPEQHSPPTSYTSLTGQTTSSPHAHHVTKRNQTTKAATSNAQVLYLPAGTAKTPGTTTKSTLTFEDKITQTCRSHQKWTTSHTADATAIQHGYQKLKDGFYDSRLRRAPQQTTRTPQRILTPAPTKEPQ